MKSKKVLLTSWEWTTDEAAHNLDIDWPRVQRNIGSDHLKWLLAQDKESCQLLLETNSTCIKLVAEFYNEHTLTTYHLMWAK